MQDETLARPATEISSAVVSASVTAARPHIGYLDSLRAVAALYVVVYHAVSTAAPGGALPGALRPIGKLMSYGNQAVALFIVLSGYCLMLPVLRSGFRLKGGAKLFFTRRALRILPPYYAALLVSLLLIQTGVIRAPNPLQDPGLTNMMHAVAAHLLLVQNFVPFFIINPAFWSIAVEWQIYFLFPLLLWCWRKIGGDRAAVGTMLWATAAAFLLRRTSLADAHVNFVGFFALGMWAAAHAHLQQDPADKRPALPIPTILAALSLAFVGVLAFESGTKVNGIWIVHDVLGACVWCFMLAALARPGAAVFRRMLEWKPLVSIGQFSYSLYLIHVPILQIVWQHLIAPRHFSQGAQFVSLTAVTLPLCLAAAYGFYRLVELPFMRMRPASRAPAAANPA